MRQICGDAFGVGVMEATIGDTTFIQKSNTAGMSIYEFDRRQPVVKDYTDVSSQLIRIAEG
ncbi:MAG: hypothetical protein IID16_06450 [Candidatus Marinimicrobia bacterium]|nr:hypothetical protein [Candidatus Neomarinimicrobiota bacterium]